MIILYYNKINITPNLAAKKSKFDMQFKALEYLEAIYKYKNFTKAAETLFVSQPAISTAIRKLEDEFNVKLIIRTQKKVLLIQKEKLSLQK